MNIPETYPEIMERRLALEMMMPGGAAAADLVFRDFNSAVIHAVSYKLKAGGVAMDLGEALSAHREAWIVFIGVRGYTLDVEQALAEVDCFLGQDAALRALGGHFHLCAWEHDYRARLVASLGKPPRYPSA